MLVVFLGTAVGQADRHEKVNLRLLIAQIITKMEFGFIIIRPWFYYCINFNISILRLCLLVVNSLK